MQKRHKDRQCYFNELANTSRSFYIDYVKQFISLSPSTHILEIGCGEGGNLLPFAELGCKVTGIDRAASRIHQAETFFAASGYKGEFTTTDFFNFSSASRYQLILIHDVIEHISNKEEFFRCLSPLLAKGGIIFGIPVLANAIWRTSANLPQPVRLLSPFHSFMSRYTLSVSAQMFP